MANYLAKTPQFIELAERLARAIISNPTPPEAIDLKPFLGEAWNQGYNYRLIEDQTSIELKLIEELKGIKAERDHYKDSAEQRLKRITQALEENDNLGAELSQIKNELRVLEDTNRSLFESAVSAAPAPEFGALPGEAPIKAGPEGVTVNHVGELHLHISFIK